jgi:RNA methyltransferase, TrmH family
MKTITSRQNPDIKHLCTLHTTKGRQEHKQFIAQGVRTCATIINAGYKPLQLYVTQEQQQKALDLVPDDIITIVNHSVMDKISTTAQPSGILALFAQPAPPTQDKLNAGLVCSQVRDPGNVGTLIRTCAAMKQRSVVLVDSVDPWNPKVVQASAGTLVTVDIFQWSWEELVDKKKDLLLAALVVKDGNTIESIKDKKVLLVVGSEAHGIPQQWINACNSPVTLSMPGKTESLNAAVAGSIALYLLYADQ